VDTRDTVAEVPLGDIDPFWEWLEREDPRFNEVTLVRQWIERAGEAPWLEPSVEIPELSDKPMHQVRQVVVPETTVEVIYRETYATGAVDLIAVMGVCGKS